MRVKVSRGCCEATNYWPEKWFEQRIHGASSEVREMRRDLDRPKSMRNRKSLLRRAAKSHQEVGGGCWRLDAQGLGRAKKMKHSASVYVVALPQGWKGSRRGG